MRSASGASSPLRVRLSRRYCAALSVTVSMRPSCRIWRIWGERREARYRLERWPVLPARAARLLLGEAIAAVEGAVLPGEGRGQGGGGATGAGGGVEFGG